MERDENFVEVMRLSMLLNEKDIIIEDLLKDINQRQKRKAIEDHRMDKELTQVKVQLLSKGN